VFYRRENPGVSFDDVLDVPFRSIELIGAEVVESDEVPTAEPDGATPTGS
jgi:hypothetical protein